MAERMGEQLQGGTAGGWAQFTHPGERRLAVAVLDPADYSLPLSLAIRNSLMEAYFDFGPSG